MTVVLLALLVHAEPTVRIAGERLPDPHRWLEDIDDPAVVAWWTAKDAEARAWISEQGSEATVAQWLKGREQAQSLATVLDEANGTRVTLHRDAGAMQGAARSAGTFIASRDGIDHPLVSTELGEDRPPCAATVDLSGRYVAWGRTLDTAHHPCRLHVTDLAEGHTWTIFEGLGLQPRFSPDGERLLVSHTEGAHGAVLELTRAGTTLGERLRSRERISVEWLADGDVVATTVGDARTGRPLSHNRVAFGPPDRLRWLGPRGLPEGRYSWVGRDGNSLLLRTNVDGERFHVVRVDPEHPRRCDWKEVEPERQGAVLAQARRLGDHLLLVWDQEGVSRLTARPLAGDAADEPLGIASSGILNVTVRGDEATVSVGSVEGAKRARLSADLGITWLDGASRRLSFATEYATSADGTAIPISVVRPPTVAREAPVWLHVYGGFGKGQRLSWTPKIDAWLAMGGIYAVVHARGGNERGEVWHDAARGVHKYRTVDDVIAVAEHFRAGGTPPDRIVLAGVSNGALVSAAAVARRPDLFGAVMADVGAYDLVRGPAMGRWWPGELGRPTGSMAEQRALRALSPLHTSPSGPLPPILLTTGRRDRVVSPAHSYKLAAAWGALAGGPVLLRVEPWITHAWRGDNPDLSGTRWSGQASDLAFVMRALHLEWRAGGGGTDAIE